MSPPVIEIAVQLIKSYLHVAGQRGHSSLLHIKWTLSCTLLQPRMRGKNTKRTHKNNIFNMRSVPSWYYMTIIETRFAYMKSQIVSA